MTDTLPRDVTRIVLTAADVLDGKPENCGSCPIALAVARAIGDPGAVIDVDGEHVTVLQHDSGWYALLPDDARAFIEAFDDHPGKRAGLARKAAAGRLAFDLHWHEGEPPEGDRDELRHG